MQSIQSAPAGRTASVRTALLALLAAAALAAGLATGAAAEAPGAGVVNVNTASVEELVRLPGIGESKARAIVDFRKERGAFKSVEQLREVKGIGDAALERIRSQVVIEGKTTLQ
jgi:competence protein ComEA